MSFVGSGLGPSGTFQDAPRGNYEDRHTPVTGPRTYMHCGAPSVGWPYDHKAEDTFEVPPLPKRHEWVEDRIYNISPKLNVVDHPELLCPPASQQTVEESEYRAEYGPSGQAFLVLDKTTTIASFDTFADAQRAAEALNNHKGY